MVSVMDQLAQVDVAGVEFADQIWWYASRAAGIVAWVLLSLTMVAGMLQSTRGSSPLPAGWSLDLHRFLSMLSLLFLTLHLAALVPDNFVEFGWAELFIPMLSTWRPGAVAWGIVGFWLVVSVQVTSLLRARLPTRVWRALHLLSFVVWVSATVHLFLAGSDVAHPAFRALQVVMIGAVSSMFVRRMVDVVRKRRAGRSVGVGSLAVEESVDVDQVDPRKRREFAA